VEQEVPYGQIGSIQPSGRSCSTHLKHTQLLFILFYLKFYPVQEVQGYLLGMGQAQAWDWILRLTPILKRALGYEKQLPARKNRDNEQCSGFSRAGIHHRWNGTHHSPSQG